MIIGRPFLVVAITCVAALSTAAGPSQFASAGDKMRFEMASGSMPLHFIENRGQLDGSVAFYVQGRDKAVYFTHDGATFRLFDPSADVAGAQSWVVKLDFVGARWGVVPRGVTRRETVISYFRGRPQDWKAGLLTYAGLRYPELWPGIDLTYSGTNNRLKYEFVVKPGADPRQIRLAYRGATNVQIDAAGHIVVATPYGGFKDASPSAYQELDGLRVHVSVAYRPVWKVDNHVFEYGFELGEYDPTRPLVIDPAIFIYCGYIGGNSGEEGQGIAVDTFGNAYVTGLAWSTESSFPIAVGPDLTQNGNSDAFVAKVSADGTSLIYCGYIGGTGPDAAYDISVDLAGNAYVTGYTNSTDGSFPVIVGPDLTHNGGYDAFVAKVNSTGTGLSYCGYIGGEEWDDGRGIEVDTENNACVTGFTSSTETTFPVMIGPDLTFNGAYDAFAAKVNASGSGLVYCGYIGGSNEDWGWDVAVDRWGFAYVGGQTNSTEASFPVMIGPDLTYNDDGSWSDAFVAKLDPDCGCFVYCGYIGGEFTDIAFGIAVDSLERAHLTGETASSESTFPAVVGPDLTYNGGYKDAFAVKVNAAGTGLDYCGYIGGEHNDAGHDICVGESQSAYVIGRAGSPETTFPVVSGPDLTYNGGVQDAFVANIQEDGTSLIYCGYIGGEENDFGHGIAVDRLESAYGTGLTNSDETTFPVTVGPDTTHNGESEVFVAKVSKPCCNHDGMRGDINHDLQGPNIVDLTYLVAHLFGGGAPPPCPEEGDVNGDGSVNIVDLTHLVAHLFGGGAPPAPCP